MAPKTLIYHTALSKDATKDDLDVLEETKFVSNVLRKIGYEVEQKSFNYKSIEEEIKKIKPSFIFNLVEAVNGKDSLAFLAPLKFEGLGIPYTGCTKRAFLDTKSKTQVKNKLKEEKVPTPYWLNLKDFQMVYFPKKTFLIKSKDDHASKNLETNLFNDKEELREMLRKKGNDFFAEEYIEGREFNVSMVGPSKKGRILPPAEILFKNWPSDKPRIVDYKAKWEEASEEYNNTERTFDFPDSDKILLKKLEEICVKCWDVFNLRGYARIDFRIDKNNELYVLEINANPCISPDAGFVAAAHKARITDEQIISNIIKDSCGEKLVLSL